MKLKKTLTTLFCTAFVMVTMASTSNDLLKYIPKKSAVVLDLNSAKILKIKSIKEALNDDSQKELVDFKADLASYNLKMDDLADNILLFVEMNQKTGEPDIGIIAKTAIKEPLAKKIIQTQCSKSNAEFSSKKINGKTVYMVKSDVASNLNSSGFMAMAPSVDDDFSVAYLESDVVLLTSQSFIQNYLAQLQKGKVGKTNTSTLVKENKSSGKDAVLWGCINLADINPATNQAPQPGQPQAPYQNIESGVFALNFTGSKQENIKFNLDVKCKDPNSSQLLAMQLQMMTGMISMQMGDNPELAAELTKSLKVSPQGNNINVSINLTKATLDKIQAYSAKKKQSGVPVPAPTK